MYLVDGARVGDGVSVLDDGHGLSSQDGLVNPKSGGVDLEQPDVSGDLVTNCNRHYGLDNVVRRR